MDKMSLLVRKQVFPYDVSSFKVLKKYSFGQIRNDDF